jgi:hypothetical protein
MKGIVLEELKDKLIVLTEEGDFIEVEKLSEITEVGEEIIVRGEKTNIKKALKRFAFAAAVFCMVIFGGYGAYGSFVTQGYVSISINPSDNKSASMEIAYNSFGKIIKLQALNNDGNALIEKMGSAQFKSTNVVINEFIRTAEKESIISQEKENTIMITITDSNKKIDDESIDSSVENYIKDNKINAKVMMVLGNKRDYKEAKQSGVSVDKFILINKAIERNPAYKFDDLNKKSIEEIIRIINEQEKNYK